MYAGQGSVKDFLCSQMNHFADVGGGRTRNFSSSNGPFSFCRVVIKPNMLSRQIDIKAFWAKPEVENDRF